MEGIEGCLLTRGGGGFGPWMDKPQEEGELVVDDSVESF